MSVMKWLKVVMLLTTLTGSAVAQMTKEKVEVAVNGPEGALLLLDGQAMGRLPLPVNLIIPAGPHRFRLELGNQNAESDTLTLPANRQAELNLTLSSRRLVAVLRITPGMLLLLPETLPEALREGITAAVAKAAKQEHSVLFGSDKQAELLRRKVIILRCVNDGDCHEPLFPNEQVSYVLSLNLQSDMTGAPDSCLLRAALLDARTRELSARVDAHPTPCEATNLSAHIGELTATLLQETAVRSRGDITISSKPDGARVLLDGRWLGVTPFQQEAFSGSRALEVRYERYLPHKATVQVEPDQSAPVTVLLQPVPTPTLPAPAPRPARSIPQIVAGSLLMGGGILVLGFGAAALASNGNCVDGSTDIGSCIAQTYYRTGDIGGLLVSTGMASFFGGAITLGIPRRLKSK